MRVVNLDERSSEAVEFAPTISRTRDIYGFTPNQKKILMCSMCFLVLLMVILTIVILVTEAIVSSVKDPKLEIDSLTVSNFNISSRPNQISANWNVQMNFKTRDSHGYFKFYNIKVLIYYNDKIVGVTNLMSFDLSPKNPPMHFGGEFFSRLSGYIDDSIISDITRGINVAGTLKFKVEFAASVKKTYKGWGTDSWYPFLWVFNCENVELVFKSSDASKAHILNGSHKCKKAVFGKFED